MNILHGWSAAVTFLAVLPAFLAVPLPAQGRVWIVDANRGPGTNFTDLPPAVAAAAPGDVVRVRAGLYHSVVIRRALSLFGEAGAEIQGGFQFFAEAVRVEGLPAGEEVSIHGFRIDGVTTITLGTPFVVVNCQGTVTIEGAYAAHRPASLSVSGNPAVSVQNSRLVVVSGSTLFGAPPVFADRSTVVVNSTTCTAHDWSGGVFEVPAPGVRALDSSVTLSRCVVQAGSVLQTGLPFYHPAPALESTRSRWVVQGGGALRAGTRTGAATPALGGDGVVRLDPRTTLVPTGNAPPIAPGFAVTMAATPSLQATGARIGNVVQLHLLAQPNDLGALLLGWLGGPIDLGLGSPLALDLARPTLATPLLVADGAGGIGFAFTAPNDSALVGFRCAWQGIAGSAANGFLLSNPDAYVH